LKPGYIIPKNRYNPFRGREFASFFEMRDSEAYMAENEAKTNLNPAVTHYRRY